MKKYTKKWMIGSMTMTFLAVFAIQDGILIHASALKPKAYDITLYEGNDQADGFVTSEATIKYKTAYSILKELKAIDAVASNVRAISLEYEGKELVLDLSKEFAEDVSSSGAAGEYIKVGSVVNTFLDAFDVETLTITVDGESWESGHVIYDAPLGRYLDYNSRNVDDDNNYEIIKDSIDQKISINMYIGNVNVDGFDIVQTNIEYKTAYSIIKALKSRGAVASNVKANSLEYEGKELVLDLSKEFAEDVSSSGAAGEYIKVGSVVNTFIDVFDVEALTITIDGQIWETGHNVYDGPIYKFE